jgi:eukaryotic-like serine/threonine-protein kinase
MQGRVLAGRYQLIAKLGEGGMGSAWRAEHLTLRTQVAVKLIDPAIAESSEALARFQREALAAAELRSSHIVQIIDYGIDDSTPFIAMELLEGESLAARLERLGKLTPDDTARILTQVSRALARAHEKGIVHRDLKPDNIFITREGEEEVIKVLDFGIAKKLDALSLGSGVRTNTGALLGTPYYMSPEQALGQTNIDHRTDIWSFGVIAYECLTGNRPFAKDTLGALLMAVCHDPLPTPSKVAVVPSGFDTWFERATARELSARFPTAMEAAEALRAIGRDGAEARTAEAYAATRLVPTATLIGGEQPDLLQTAGPASITIPGVTTRKLSRYLVYLALPTLGLALALGYAMWQQLRPRYHVAAVAPAVPSLAVSAAPVFSVPQGEPATRPMMASGAVTVRPVAPASAEPSIVTPDQLPLIASGAPSTSTGVHDDTRNPKATTTLRDQPARPSRPQVNRAPAGQNEENSAGF